VHAATCRRQRRDDLHGYVRQPSADRAHGSRRRT
jgi:hypothetical protein